MHHDGDNDDDYDDASLLVVLTMAMLNNGACLEFIS